MTTASNHSILKHECHLHLYGCLDAKSCWPVVEARANAHPSRFQWFLAEYERMTGIQLDPKRRWFHPDGFSSFQEIFVCDRSVPFDLFQAKFNLLIALFPPDAKDLWLADVVFKAHATTGGYKEYRTFLPLYLPSPERANYLRGLLDLARLYESSHYHPRIAISLLRSDREMWEGYHFLRKFMRDNPDVSSMITGIDFCGNERGHPPSAKFEFFRQVLLDNQTQQRLDILYHVGEMWQDVSIASAARWCVEAAVLGARRLGHATALGMGLSSLVGGRIHEVESQTAEHLAWIRNNLGALQNFGFGPSDYAWIKDRADANLENGYVAWVYDHDLIEHTTRFQTAAMGMIKTTNPVIECCPTSNIRIGQLKDANQHPLLTFLNQGLEVVVATDDPGVFDITLASEESLLRRDFFLDTKTLQRMDDVAGNLLTR